VNPLLLRHVDVEVNVVRVGVDTGLAINNCSAPHRFPAEDLLLRPDPLPRIRKGPPPPPSSPLFAAIAFGGTMMIIIIACVRIGADTASDAAERQRSRRHVR
jgi:hypothetical protein